MKIVLDTNVLVSALLTPHGTSAKILDLILKGELILLLDDRILNEYKEVLMRKKFMFNRDSVDDLIDYFVISSEHVTASNINLKLNDPFDLAFLEVAASGNAKALITGNKKHYPLKKAEFKILTPSEFLAIFS